MNKKYKIKSSYEIIFYGARRKVKYTIHGNGDIYLANMNAFNNKNTPFWLGKAKTTCCGNDIKKAWGLIKEWTEVEQEMPRSIKKLFTRKAPNNE